MEGAFVYLENNYIANLVMYKEINDGVIFYLQYNKNYIYYNHISIYAFDYLFKNRMKNSIFILNSLPYINNIDITLNVWRNIAYDKLVNS
jgi:hypothetical protein